MNKNNLKHGYCRTPIYTIWAGMKTRCCNKNSKDYIRYAGRGISICEEWMNSPKAFCDWALSNGWKKGLFLDRINNDGNYCPENCRFVTITESNRNKRHPTQIKKKSTLPIGIRPSSNKFSAKIEFQTQCVNLGIFNTVEEAKVAREKALELAKSGNPNWVSLVETKNKHIRRFPKGVRSRGKNRKQSFFSIINYNESKIYLGSFKTIEEASQVYQDANDFIYNHTKDL